jgi:hypothetical protein
MAIEGESDQKVNYQKPLLLPLSAINWQNFPLPLSSQDTGLIYTLWEKIPPTLNRALQSGGGALHRFSLL